MSWKISLGWGVKMHDSSERHVTQFWHPVGEFKRNQARQSADMNSHRKTEMKDPHSKKGMQRNTRWTYVDGQNQRPIPVNHGNHHLYGCQQHNNIINQSLRRREAWANGHCSATFKHYNWCYRTIDTISTYSICISTFRVIWREIIVIYQAYCLY